MGDFNIDINTAGIEVYKLDKFCNLFDLTNLIKAEACCTKNQKYAIGLFLTNRPLSLQKLSKSMLPQKKKILRGNHAPFINREFRKEIYKRDRLRNNFWKDPSEKNNFFLRTEETNVSHCGEDWLNLIFKMLLRRSCQEEVILEFRQTYW